MQATKRWRKSSKGGMAYSVAILPRAQKELAQIPQSAFTRTVAAIRALAQNPRPPGYIKLTNRLAGASGWASIAWYTTLTTRHKR